MNVLSLTSSSLASSDLKEEVTLRPKLFHFKQYLAGSPGADPEVIVGSLSSQWSPHYDIQHLTSIPTP